MAHMYNIVFFLTFLIGCENKSGEDPDAAFAYRLSHPEVKYILPGKLQEVSGLGYLGNDKIGCLQDEDGIIFIFDLLKKEVTKEIDFGKDRDYEGFDIGNESAFVLRSDGQIFEIRNFLSKKRKVKKHETNLNSKNDTEGLCYDSKNDRLLVACKGSPGKGKSLKNKKAIYSFDLKKNKLEKKPVFVIDVEEIQAFINTGFIVKMYERIMRFFKPSEGQITFRPSGIAIHPHTEDIYIISSVGKLLVILKPNGEISQVEKLDPDIFKQPEGITFSENADLFIANEGAGGKANILKFTYHNDE